MVALLRGGRILLPFPFPILAAVGPVVPVALAHQRHPHPHVQGPVACGTAALASLDAVEVVPGSKHGNMENRGHPFPVRSLHPWRPQTCPFSRPTLLHLCHHSDKRWLRLTRKCPGSPEAPLKAQLG